MKNSRSDFVWRFRFSQVPKSGAESIAKFKLRARQKLYKLFSTEMKKQEGWIAFLSEFKNPDKDLYDIDIEIRMPVKIKVRQKKKRKIEDE